MALPDEFVNVFFFKYFFWGVLAFFPKDHSCSQVPCERNRICPLEIAFAMRHMLCLPNGTGP